MRNRGGVPVPRVVATACPMAVALTRAVGLIPAVVDGLSREDVDRRPNASSAVDVCAE